jgi:predicted ATPase
MINLVEVINFRCLKQIRQPLHNFEVLIGPNGSGKTSFLDVMNFIKDLIDEDLAFATLQRSPTFRDLVWKRQPDEKLGWFFELALEAEIPEELQVAKNQELDSIRYIINIQEDIATNEIKISKERIVLFKKDAIPRRNNFSSGLDYPRGSLCRDIFVKRSDGKVSYRTEKDDSNRDWLSYSFNIRKSAFSNLPEDKENFPATNWFKNLLSKGIRQIALDSSKIRQASKPGQGLLFIPDGSNLPWVIEDLKEKNSAYFESWIVHLQTALPNIENIRTVRREDDGHRYLIIEYNDGLEVPSWSVSDGTLRMLALTILAYLPNLVGIYLIEEPENGIHPNAIETVYEALSRVYDAQILLATHSPILLNLANPDEILCFSKSQEGATQIISGAKHPALERWRGKRRVGDLFASGVLDYSGALD